MPKTPAALAPRIANKRVQRTLLAALRRHERANDKAEVEHIKQILNGAALLPGGKRA